ncbi:hypothetical protein Tco_0065636 [Tanacetum coccineum]
MRTKPGVDSLSFDDLYNNLRVFESDVKGSTGSSFSAQNVAFVSSKSTSSTNDVSTAYSVSTSSGYNSQKENSSSYTDELISKGNQESISRECKGNTRYKTKDNERRPGKQEKPKALVTLDGEGVDWTGHAEDELENFALMAYSNSGSDTKREQLGDASIEIKAYTLALEKKLLAEAVKEKEELKTKLENFQSSSKGLSKLLNSQMSAKDKSRHACSSPSNDRKLHASRTYKRSNESMFTRTKQSKTSESDAKTSDFDSCETNSSVETLESVPEPVVVEPKVVSQPKVWSDASFIEEYESDSDDEYVIESSKEQEKPSFAFVNIVKHVKTPRETVKEQNTCSPNPKGKGTGQEENRPVWNNVQRSNHQNKFVPKAVLTKTGIFSVNTARQNPFSQAAETSIARKVNTARPIVNEIRLRNNFYKSHSPIRRLFNKLTAPKAKFTNNKVNIAGDKTVSDVRGYRKTAVKASAGCNWRPKRHYWTKVSKYNSGSNSNKNVNFKDPLGRPKSAMAWVPKRN